MLTAGTVIQNTLGERHHDALKWVEQLKISVFPEGGP